MRWFFALLCGVCGIAGLASADIVHVDASAMGTGSGEDWANAKTDLRAALADAAVGDELWVAAGVYHPSVDDRSVSFELRSGIEVYGGFSGVELARDDRDWVTHATILSGEIGALDPVSPPSDASASNSFPSDNTCHVVIGSGTDRSAVLDGFTIERGAAQSCDGSYGGYGSGMLNVDGSPTLRNLVFRHNDADVHGGAIFNAEGSSPSIAHCEFLENFAAIGAGIMNDESCPEIRDTVFRRNDALISGGGLVYAGGGCSDTLERLEFYENDAINGIGALELGAPLRCVDLIVEDNVGGSAGAMVGGESIVNARFVGNLSQQGGGGAYIGSADIANAIFVDNHAAGTSEFGLGGALELTGSSTLRNVTIAGNGAAQGGGVWLSGGATPTFENSILWGNELFTSNPDEAVRNIGGDGTPTFVHCLVEGSGGSGAWNASMGVDGGGNLDGDPLFIDLAEEDLHLTPGSPAIDSGDNALVPAWLPFDLDGEERVAGLAVDMGAYESPSEIVGAKPVSFGRFRARGRAGQR